MKFTFLSSAPIVYSRGFSLSYKLPISVSNVTSSEKSFLLPHPKLSSACSLKLSFSFIYNLTTWNCYLLFAYFYCLNTPTRGKFHQSRGLVCLVLQGPWLLTVAFALPSSAPIFPQLFILLAPSHPSCPSSNITFVERLPWPYVSCWSLLITLFFHQGLQSQAINGDCDWLSRKGV